MHFFLRPVLELISGMLKIAFANGPKLQLGRLGSLEIHIECFSLQKSVFAIIT